MKNYRLIQKKRKRNFSSNGYVGKHSLYSMTFTLGELADSVRKRIYGKN